MCCRYTEHEMAYFTVYVAHPLPKARSKWPPFFDTSEWRVKASRRFVDVDCWHKPLLTPRILFCCVDTQLCEQASLVVGWKPEITMFVSRLSLKCSILWININQHFTAKSRARKWKSIKFMWKHFTIRKENTAQFCLERKLLKDNLKVERPVPF